MEHSEIVTALEDTIEKMTNDPKVVRFDAAMLVKRACIPAEDRESALKIADDVMKRKFGGYSDEEFERQLQWRDEQIMRHAETLPFEEREAYLKSEAEKYEQEGAEAFAYAEALKRETGILRAEGRFEAEPEADRYKGGIGS
jgi:hypothetical protein